MALVSHSRRGAVKPLQRGVRHIFMVARGAFDDGGLQARLRTRELGAGVAVGDPPEQVCSSSQIVFSRVAREPLERDEAHIVTFLT